LALRELDFKRKRRKGILYKVFFACRKCEAFSTKKISSKYTVFGVASRFNISELVLFMDYRRMLSKLLSKSEFESYKDSERGWDDVRLFKYLSDVGVIHSFDWKHCDEYDIYLFIDERLCSVASLGLEPLNITSSSATELYSDIHSNGKRDYVSFVLKFYNKILISTEWRLMTIDRQDDCHNLVLVKAIDIPRLKHIKSNFWKFCDVK